MTTRVRYEHTDVAARPVLLAVAALVVLLVLAACFAAIFGATASDARRQSAGSSLPPLASPDPRHELADYQAEQARKLDSYGWIDRDTGEARIPIERAMDIVIERAGSAPAEARR